MDELVEYFWAIDGTLSEAFNSLAEGPNFPGRELVYETLVEIRELNDAMLYSDR